MKKLCTLAEKGERVDTAVVQYAVSLLEKGELDQLDNLYGEIVATTFRAAPSAARRWASGNMCARSAATR